MAKLIALAVALLGALLVLAGGLQATTFAAPSVTSAGLTSPGRPVVSTAVGLLDLEGPRLTVQATTTGGAGRPVFIGIGRASDVDAYLAKVSRLEAIGRDGDGRLITEELGNEASLPDPASADVWVVSVRGKGTATLAWPNSAGQWRLVTATDGTESAPESLSLTWSGREQHTTAPALIAIGLVLLVGGLITLVMLQSRARLEGGRADGSDSDE